MSHKATMWAIQQRGLPPAAKLVLWHLADRYHPDNGCFPSQETLAEDCELSRSGLNNQLATLETAGLIRREKRRDDATNRQQATRYRFAFEGDFEQVVEGKPCPEFGHGAVSKNQGEPCPKNGPSRVQTVGHEPVREPVSEPERECARDLIVLFERARRAWPTGFADGREEALIAWQALSGEERQAAADEITRYVSTTKSVGRKFFGTFAAYLAERKWLALPERPARTHSVPVGNAAAATPPTPPKSKFLQDWDRRQAASEGGKP